MLRDIIFGTLAGAAGTVALNIVTYADMALRGRHSSDVPAKLAEKVAAGVGVDLSGNSGVAHANGEHDKETAQQRASGIGALLGYVNGLGIGTAYGVLRLRVKSVPVPVAGIFLGGAAMAASDAPSIRLKVTDPNEWGTSGWLADIVPHVAYGLVTAIVFEMLTSTVQPPFGTLRSLTRR